MLELTIKAEVANVAPPKLGSRKSSKIRLILETEYSDERWAKLGKLMMHTDGVDVVLSGEEIQPELDNFEPQEEQLEGMEEPE